MRSRGPDGPITRSRSSSFSSLPGARPLGITTPTPKSATRRGNQESTLASPTTPRGTSPARGETLEQLLDRILQELRGHRRGPEIAVEIAASTGPLRARLLKFLRQFFDVSVKQGIQTQTAAAAAGAWIDGFPKSADSKIAEMQAELSEARARTAQVKSELSQVQADLMKVPKANRDLATEIAEARADAAFARAQLANVKITLQRSEERAQQCEEMRRIAENRAEDAEASLQAVVEDKERNELELKQVTDMKTKIAEERKTKAEELKRRADDRFDLETGRLARAEKRAQRAEERLEMALESTTPRRDLCPHCGRPVDGFPEVGARAPRKPAVLMGETSRNRADIYPTVLELKQQEAREIEKLRRIYLEGSEFNASDRLAERYHRKLCDTLLRKCASGWLAVTVRSQVGKKKRDEDENKIKLKQMQELYKKKDGNAAQAAEKMAEMYHAKLLREMKNDVLEAWHAFSSKAQSARNALQQEKQLADLQARNAWQIERGSEVSEHVATKYNEKRMRKQVKHIVFVWEDFVRKSSASRKLEKELEQLLSVKKDRTSEAMQEKKCDVFRRMGKLRMRTAFFKAWSNFSSKSAEEKRIREDLAELGEQEERLIAQALTRADQMANKMQKMRETSMQLAFFGSWSKIAKSEKTAREQEKVKSGLETDLDRMKASRAKELEVLRKRGADEGGRVPRPDNFAWQQRTDLMADLAFKKANLPLLRTVILKWREGMIAMAADRSREKRLINQQNMLKRVKREGRGGKDAERMAQIFYDNHVLNIASELLSEWRLRTIDTKLDRKDQQLKEQLDSEKAKLKAEEEALKKEQDALIALKKSDLDKKLDQLKKVDRETGDLTAEKIAATFRKRAQIDIQREIVTRWQVRTKEFTAERQRRKHENEMQAKMEKTNQNMEKLKETYANSEEKGGQVAEKMGEAFRKRLEQALLRSCLLAWGTKAGKDRAERIREERELEFEEEMERLKMLDRKNDEKVANQVADLQFAKHLNRVLYRSIQGWLAEALKLKVQRQYDESQLKLDLEIKNLQSQERKKGDARAEQMAATFRKKVQNDIKRKVWNILLNVVDDAQDAKEVAKHKAKHEEELQRVDMMYRKKGDRTAEQMAETHYRRKCQDWLEVVIRAWLSEVHACQWARKEASMRSRQEKELANLKQKERMRGDEIAENMAQQYRKRVNHASMMSCWSLWQQYVVLEQREKAEKALLEEAEKNVEAARQDERRQAAKLREEQALEIAKQNEKKVFLAMLQEVLGAWRTWYQDKVAEKRFAEEKRKHERELEELQEIEREKGDATAQLLAEKFHRKLCFEMMRDIFAPWRVWTKDEKMRNAAEQAEKALAKEMARREETKRQEKEEAAIRTATAYRRKQLWVAVERCIGAWARAMMYVKANREAKEAKAHHDLLIEAIQRRFDNTAEGISRQLYYRRNYLPVTRCLWAWYHSFFLEVFEYQQQVEYEKMQEKFEDDMAKMTRILNDRYDTLQQDLKIEQSDFFRVLLMQRVFMAWSQARVDQQANSLVASTQFQFEGDLSDFIRSQGKVKRKLVVQTSEYCLKNVLKPIQQGFFNTWRLIVMLNVARRQTFKERTAMQQYTKAATTVARQKGEAGLGRVAAHIALLARQNLLRRCIAVLREDKWVGVLKKTEKDAADHLKAEMLAMQSLATEQAAKAALDLAHAWNRTGEMTALVQCFHAWSKDTLNTVLQTRHMKDIQQQIRLHKEDVQEKDRDREWEQFNAGIKQEKSQAVDEVVKAQQGDAEETRPAHGGPKKRPESSASGDKTRHRGKFAAQLMAEFEREDEEIEQMRRDGLFTRGGATRKRRSEGGNASTFFKALRMPNLD